MPIIAFVSAASTPADPGIGDTVTTDVRLRNDGAAGNMVIGLEIYFNSVSVDRMYTGDEFFEAGEERVFTIPHTPAEKGMYGVDMGIWGEGWSYFQEWISHIGEFTVTDDTHSPSGVVVYDDVLQSGWSNWSWDAVVTFGASIAVEFTQEWGGLYLHHDALDTAGMKNLEFDIGGGTAGGQQLQVLAFDAQTELLPPKRLSDYAGDIPAEGTMSVAIPLADLGIQPGDTITGFGLQGISGFMEPLFFVDAIRLSS